MNCGRDRHGIQRPNHDAATDRSSVVLQHATSQVGALAVHERHTTALLDGAVGFQHTASDGCVGDIMEVQASTKVSLWQHGGHVVTIAPSTSSLLEHCTPT